MNAENNRGAEKHEKKNFKFTVASYVAVGVLVGVGSGGAIVAGPVADRVAHLTRRHTDHEKIFGHNGARDWIRGAEARYNETLTNIAKQRTEDLARNDKAIAQLNRLSETRHNQQQHQMERVEDKLDRILGARKR